MFDHELIHHHATLPADDLATVRLAFVGIGERLGTHSPNRARQRRSHRVYAPGSHRRRNSLSLKAVRAASADLVKRIGIPRSDIPFPSAYPCLAIDRRRRRRRNHQPTAGTFQARHHACVSMRTWSGKNDGKAAQAISEAWAFCEGSAASWVPISMFVLLRRGIK